MQLWTRTTDDSGIFIMLMRTRERERFVMHAVRLPLTSQYSIGLLAIKKNRTAVLGCCAAVPSLTLPMSGERKKWKKN